MTIYLHPYFRNKTSYLKPLCSSSKQSPWCILLFSNRGNNVTISCVMLTISLFLFIVLCVCVWLCVCFVYIAYKVWVSMYLHTYTWVRFWTLYKNNFTVLILLWNDFSHSIVLEKFKMLKCKSIICSFSLLYNISYVNVPLFIIFSLEHLLWFWYCF